VKAEGIRENQCQGQVEQRNLKMIMEIKRPMQLQRRLSEFQCAINQFRTQQSEELEVFDSNIISFSCGNAIDAK
jgi:hypothetical protein